MKKFLLTIMSSMGVVGLFAQLTPSTTPSNKNVIIEDLTGIHCGYCPDGAKIADQFRAASGADRVIIIGNHAGSYATPGSGANRLDFRTNDGNVVNAASVPTGYPAGNVNRKVTAYSMTPGKTAMGRGYWTTVGAQVLAEPSPLNLAISATYNSGTSTINIEVAGYYTAASSGSDYLTVAILQDNIDSYQSGASGYPARIQPSGLYRQMDVLRDYITTSPFGDAITNTGMGATFNKTFTYDASTPVKHNVGAPNTISDVVPKIDDMKVVAFVTQDQAWSEVITATEVDVSVHFVGINETTSLNDLSIYPNPFQTSALINFNLEESTELTVNMFDVTGKMVHSIPTTTYSVGNHNLTIDGANLESGMYYVNFIAPDGIMTRKLMLNK